MFLLRVRNTVEGNWCKILVKKMVCWSQQLVFRSKLDLRTSKEELQAKSGHHSSLGSSWRAVQETEEERRGILSTQHTDFRVKDSVIWYPASVSFFCVHYNNFYATHTHTPTHTYRKIRSDRESIGNEGKYTELIKSLNKLGVTIKMAEHAIEAEHTESNLPFVGGGRAWRVLRAQTPACQ